MWAVSDLVDLFKKVLKSLEIDIKLQIQDFLE